jgi:hypothetical protein
VARAASSTILGPVPRGVLQLLLLGVAVMGGCAVASSSAEHHGAAPSPGASAADAGQPPPEAGSAPADASPAPPTPLGVTPNTWAWLDVPGARCGDGSATGIGVNVRPGASRVLLFLQGGGACSDGTTCWTAPTAAHIATGFGPADLEGELSRSPFLFSRSDPTNPFRDAHFVFVPYCTGDLHAGNGIATYDVGGVPTDTYHYGARNLDAVLARLGGNLGVLDRAWLVGESAGGFGTVVNQDAVARALGVRVDVVDDSGPPLRFGATGYPPSWHVRLPAGCTDCESGLDRVFAFERLMHPTTRFGFIVYTSDTALPGLFGVTPAALEQSIAAFVTSFAVEPNAKSFLAVGSGHAVLGSPQGVSPGLRLWLAQMATDDRAWSNAQY